MKIRESAMPEESLWASFFDPPRILRSLLLEDPSADVVEFGCGFGTFTTPAARMTSGTVHAIDVDPAMIRATKLKAKQEGLDNVRFHQRDFVALGTGLGPASVDYAMLFNILHAPEPVALLREAFRVLRPDGKIGIIHWNPEQTPRGPDISIRPRPEQCLAWLEQAGFEIALQPIPLPPHHYGLVGARPRSTTCDWRIAIALSTDSEWAASKTQSTASPRTFVPVLFLDGPALPRFAWRKSARRRPSPD